MHDLGLDVAIDAIGNVVATRAGTDPTAAPVMVGSHIDTVRTGGRFDGNLGVLGGLEVVETLEQHGIATRRPIRSRSSPTRRVPGSRPTCSAASSTSAAWRWRRRSTCAPPTTALGSATSWPASATPAPHRARRRLSARVRRTAHRAGAGPRGRGHHHRRRHRRAGHLVDRARRSPGSRRTPAPRRCACATIRAVAAAITTRSG